MHRQLSVIFCFSLLGAACASSSPPTAESVKSSAAAQASLTESPYDDETDEAAIKNSTNKVSPLAQRRVGDFFVHRFSGSFSDKPLTLTEDVIARAGNLVMIEYTLEAPGETPKILRVTHDIHTDRVLRVRELKKGKEVSVDREVYEKMVARTLFVPDANHGKTSQEKSTCLVAGDEVDCETMHYKVSVDGKPATFSLTRSSDLFNRDIGGEIATSEGNVIYRAELIDMGRGSTTKDVASRD